MFLRKQRRWFKCKSRLERIQNQECKIYHPPGGGEESDRLGSKILEELLFLLPSQVCGEVADQQRLGAVCVNILLVLLHVS